LGEIIGLFLMAVSPVILYGLIRIHLPTIAGVAGGVLVFALGLYLLLKGGKIFSRQKAKPVKAQTTA